jgi:hypothetical protein
VSLTFKPFLKDFNAEIRWPGPLVRPPTTELLFKDNVAVLSQPLHEVFVRVKQGTKETLGWRLTIDKSISPLLGSTACSQSMNGCFAIAISADRFISNGTISIGFELTRDLASRALPVAISGTPLIESQSKVQPIS